MWQVGELVSVYVCVCLLWRVHMMRQVLLVSLCVSVSEHACLSVHLSNEMTLQTLLVSLCLCLCMCVCLFWRVHMMQQVLLVSLCVSVYVCLSVLEGTYDAAGLVGELVRVCE
jgi:hypothetical protein